MSRRVGWRAVVWVGVALGCGLAPARADVYVVRDGSGAIVITNVPAGSEESASARVLAEDESEPVFEFDRSYAAAPRVASFSPRPDDGRYDDLIQEVADANGVEFALVKAVIRVESGFDPFAISRKGAEGLMQLMPHTARSHGVRESFRPRDNVEAGVRHLRGLLDRYRGNLPLALAAYNAGAGRVEASGGAVPAIAETRDYVLRVLRYRKLYLEQEGGGVLQARR